MFNESYSLAFKTNLDWPHNEASIKNKSTNKNISSCHPKHQAFSLAACLILSIIIMPVFALKRAPLIFAYVSITDIICNPLEYTNLNFDLSYLIAHSTHWENSLLFFLHFHFHIVDLEQTDYKAIIYNLMYNVPQRKEFHNNSGTSSFFFLHNVII